MSKRGNKASNKRKTPVKTPQPKLATPTKKAVKQEPVKQVPVKQESFQKYDAAHGGGGGGSGSTKTESDPEMELDNSFRQFRRLCADIADVNSYNEKTRIVSTYLRKGNSGNGFKGDVYLLLKLLLPGVVKVVYNLNSKQLVKIFSQVLGTSQKDMVENLEQGDVAETVKIFFEKSHNCPPQKKSVLSIQEADWMLMNLSQYAKEDDQQRVLTQMAARSTANDLKMLVRLIKHDLRINAGAKHILDGLDPKAYQAFQASRNLQDVVDRVTEIRSHNAEVKPGGLTKSLMIQATLLTPVLPMLAEACKSVEYAFKKCPNGMYAEIKYDGERVQVHKQGGRFEYFSRSLKPVLPHKVQHFKEFIPQAFPGGSDLILDSEVLLVDTQTSKPLPFGTLGVHKKQAFQDAKVCLFVFDCLHYNGESLMNKPLKERRKILHKNMVEIPNRIMFSEMQHITRESDGLADLMMKVFREGLEGLVLKDINGVYEPGKRHWLKVKKDYLAQGAMADTADLVVLGAYFGTGNKGGMMSIFLMGVYDPATYQWCTVTKCGIGFDDKTLEQLQKDIKVDKISKDYSKLPTWLNVNKSLVPDFVVKDPKNSPVWEITGAEFSKSEAHTAKGISIRFPRCTKVRDDKTWKEATNLPRLQVLFEKSKEYSDIPNPLGTSPTKGGPFKKRSATATLATTPTKQRAMDRNNSNEAEVVSEDDDHNGSTHSSRNGSSSSLLMTPVKRKTSQDTEDESPSKMRQDTKPPYKYGVTCYQKHPEHLANFDHLGKRTASPEKKPKLEILPEFKKLRKYIIAFDGEVVDEFHRSCVNYFVSESEEDCDMGKQFVTADWVFKCIKKKSIVPQHKSKPS
ncbi:hypothetical protein LSAT2_017077 [Lamellibrachia satsuma]|nr:hypothetical protein LSAT2_017077 [Lamellibrachia satsuma]